MAEGLRTEVSMSVAVPSEPRTSVSGGSGWHGQLVVCVAKRFEVFADCGTADRVSTSRTLHSGKLSDD